MTYNPHYLDLQRNYLFTEIASRTAEYTTQHPELRVIRLGIGDAVLPLPPVVIEAMHRAVDELSNQRTFRGYAPEVGYDFLRRAVVEHIYRPWGVEFTTDEVFISDGAGSDIGNILDILGGSLRVAVLDPVYPAYVDTNVMAGHAGQLQDGVWSNIIYLPCEASNGFCPQLPDQRPDVIYLCFPNNPTGTTLTRSQLKQWVDYALANDVLIIFDAAYEAFVRDEDVPHSIYEIPGARRVAIEISSLSKTAGFTGVRCGYTVVPSDIRTYTADGVEVSLRTLWSRRQCTKYNGTSYIAQRAAEAALTPLGHEQSMENIRYYQRNADALRAGLQQLGLHVYGGQNSPYLWVQVPDGYDSWSFFDYLLTHYGIVSTPGVGFGSAGEGYIRLSSFALYDDCQEALTRLRTL